MYLKKIFILVFLIFIFNPALSQDELESEGEEKTPEQIQEEKSWQFKQMPYAYQNIQVPREFWDTAKSLLIEAGSGAKNVDNFSIVPISVQVELYTQDSLVLKDKINHRLLFVEGGGELDLFEYVIGKGAFSIRFSPIFVNEKNFHMVYISQSPEKKVNGDLWGNGCGKIFNLTEKANDFMIDHGLNVTSSRKHYLHLMAGVYIIFQLVEDRLYLGYIRVTDSRYPQFKCKEAQD